jgi:F-box and leucine-rich repeat protein GRR1
LAENCVRLENINISNIPSLTRRSIHTIADHCISLKTLNVKKSNGVENDAITNILQKCSQLVKLDISHCQNVTKSWLSEKNTISMNVALSLSLREIFLNGNGSITSAVLMRILTSCTCLKHIGVANCISIYGLIIENWTEHPQPVPCACKSTRISSTVDNSKRVENSKHSHIISINLNMSSNIEDTTITQITDICPDLRQINLSGCTKLTANILPTIFRNCCFIDKIELQKMLFLRENHIEN